MSVIAARIIKAVARRIVSAAQPRLGRVLARVVVGLLLAASPAQGQLLAERSYEPAAVPTLMLRISF